MDEPLIALAAELQLAHHHNKLELTFKQRRAKTGLFESLNWLLSLNLGKLMAEEGVDIAGQMRQHASQLDEGIVESALGEVEADAQVAIRLLELLHPAGLGDPQEDRDQSLPREFHSAEWFPCQRMLLALSPREETSETEFDWPEVRQLHRFVRQRAGQGDGTARGWVEFIAWRFKDQRRKQLIAELVAAASDRPTVYARLADVEWIGRLHAAGGPLAVAQRLVASLALCHACHDDDEAAELESHLLGVLPTLRSQFQIMTTLGRVAEEAGISDDLRVLLNEASDEASVRRLLKLFAVPGGTPCTITAQRLGAKLLRRYGAGNAKTLGAFTERMRCLQLDPAIAELIEEQLCSDSALAIALLNQQADLRGLTRGFRQSLEVARQFTSLCLLAMATMSGPRLGGVSRGLSLLMRMRRDRRIDDQHYGRMIEALTGKLPGSLLLLEEVPDGMDPRLSRLFIPLLVAIELYDESSGSIQYLSDAYYQLGKHDRHGGAPE
ncbi:MAG: hypothetical protein KDB14_17385 [Planctomycetales bacterium]|nr:hypothetical protein [Planctomycetales bacterium]